MVKHETPVRMRKSKLCLLEKKQIMQTACSFALKECTEITLSNNVYVRKMMHDK